MATESWVVIGPQVIEVEAVRTVRVHVNGGRVDVVAHDDPTRTDARLEVHRVDGFPLEVVYADGELRIKVRSVAGLDGILDRLRSGRQRDRIDVHLAVPRSVAVNLASVNADLLLAGVQEDATVSTVNGGVVVDGTRGALSAKSVGSDVVVRDHTGDLTVGTVSGAAIASGALSRVSVTTVSGEVTLDCLAATSVCQVRTVSGDVAVRLPAGHGVGIEARSVSGRVVVDGVSRGERRPGRTTVDLRDPQATCFVTSQTVSGHLTVLHGAPLSGTTGTWSAPDAAPGPAAPPAPAAPDAPSAAAPAAAPPAPPTATPDAGGAAPDAGGAAPDVA
ncbi:MAG TPA: DUF4097 family beta strand repeat-containing protein [Cellulomonas sp.]